MLFYQVAVNTSMYTLLQHPCCRGLIKQRSTPFSRLRRAVTFLFYIFSYLKGRNWQLSVGSCQLSVVSLKILQTAY